MSEFSSPASGNVFLKNRRDVSEMGSPSITIGFGGSSCNLGGTSLSPSLMFRGMFGREKHASPRRALSSCVDPARAQRSWRPASVCFPEPSVNEAVSHLTLRGSPESCCWTATSKSPVSERRRGKLMLTTPSTLEQFSSTSLCRCCIPDSTPASPPTFWPLGTWLPTTARCPALRSSSSLRRLCKSRSAKEWTKLVSSDSCCLTSAPSASASCPAAFEVWPRAFSNASMRWKRTGNPSSTVSQDTKTFCSKVSIRSRMTPMDWKSASTSASFSTAVWNARCSTSSCSSSVQ
mmetsp:Transcript_12504/g.34528  ORF Transcript_12504/g.34528 Transcript_12504/m.34528 type:complete len:291 (+) Transcript_12504:664-1536(+)